MPDDSSETTRKQELDEDALRNLAGFLDVLVQMDLNRRQQEGKQNGNN
jgi:hypothetical protein